MAIRGAPAIGVAAALGLALGVHHTSSEGSTLRAEWDDMCAELASTSFILPRGPLSSVVSSTERAGRFIPAASVSVQTQTESIFFWNSSSTTRRKRGRIPA